MPVLFVAMTFFSTLLGGSVGLYWKDKVHSFLGLTAGVLLGVVAFDILPEMFEIIQKNNFESRTAMIALVAGFLVFHIFEKLLLIHHSHEEIYQRHHHPTVGILSALALAGHSFMDGVGIGLGFQISPQLGIFVGIAVIAHDFADGLNTVSLMLIHHNTRKDAFKYLLIDAAAPLLGALSTLMFSLPENWVVLYLGFFCGFLLYIGAADILPEAHSKDTSLKTVLLTILGVAFIFVITKFV